MSVHRLPTIAEIRADQEAMKSRGWRDTDLPHLKPHLQVGHVLLAEIDRLQALLARIGEAVDWSSTSEDIADEAERLLLEREAAQADLEEVHGVLSGELGREPESSAGKEVAKLKAQVAELDQAARTAEQEAEDLRARVDELEATAAREGLELHAAATLLWEVAEEIRQELWVQDDDPRGHAYYDRLTDILSCPNEDEG